MVKNNQTTRDKVRQRLDAELQKQRSSFTQYEPVQLEDVPFDPEAIEGNPYKDYTPQYNFRAPSFSPSTEAAPAILSGLSQPYKVSNGEMTNYLEQFVNINARDALKINLESSLNEFRENEAKWLPEVEEAKRYLEAKEYLKARNLLHTIDSVDTNRNRRVQAAINRNSKISEAIKTVRELEPKVKDYAISNPFLRDVFYGKKEYYGPTGNVTGSIDPERYVSTDRFQNGNRWVMIEEDMWNAKSDFTDPIVQLNQLQQNLNELNKDYSDRKQELKDKYSGLTTARYLHDPLLGIVPTGIYYDPSKIDPELDRRRSEEEISILNPESWKYGLLHLGSSYSEAQMMAAQMSLATALKFGTKLAAGMTGPWSALLLTAGEQAMGAWFTNYFREKETGSEVMSNYISRVLDESNKGNIDLNRVLQQYSEQLEQQGYDTSKMDDMTKLELGLAFNFNTTDDGYNNIAKQSVKGLKRLESINNALSLSDYLENFGLTHTGKYITRMFGSEAKRFGNRLLQSKAAQLLDNKATQLIRQKINRASGKLFDTVGKKLKYAHIKNQLRDMGLSMGKRWIAERSEEGIQYLAGKEYALGKYDDSDNYSFLRGIVDDARLATEANLAYYGLSGSDPYNTDEQLKRSMEIGGFIGVLLGGAAATADNAIDLRRQLKADDRINRIAADGYEKAENTFKARVFLDGIKNGKSQQYLLNSLEDMKRFKPAGVTDEMIDEDKELVKDVDAIYRNALIDKNLARLKIKRNSQDFEDFVVSNIDVSNRYKKASEAYRNGYDNYNKTVEEIIKDESPNQFNTILKQEYDAYTKGLKDGESPLDYLTFKRNIINAILIKEQRSVANRLKKDLQSRQKTLEQLKEEQDLDVNTNDIASITDYITEMFKRNDEPFQKLGGSETFKNTKIQLPNIDEIRKQFAANLINGGITDALGQKLNAYVSGRLNTKFRGYFKQKPLFSTLTDEQKQNVTQEYSDKIKQEKKTTKEPTQKQIIAKYNYDVEQEWNKVEQSANVEENERFLANLMFQEDINRVRNQRRIAEDEIDEQYSNRTERQAEEEQEQIDQQTVSPDIAPAEALNDMYSDLADRQAQPQGQQPQQPEQTEEPEQADQQGQSEQQGSEEQQPPQPDAISPDQIDEELNDAADKDNFAPDQIQEFEPDEVDNVVTGGTDISTIPVDNVTTTADDMEFSPEFNKVEIDGNMVGISEQIDRVDDGMPFDDGGAQPVKTDIDQTEVSQEKDDQSEDTVTQQDKDAGSVTQSEDKPQVEEEQSESPATQNKVDPSIKTADQSKKLTIESVDGTDDKQVDLPIGEAELAAFSNGQDLWIGNSDVEIGTHISDAMLEMQEVFDEFDSNDSAFTEEARRATQTNKSPGLPTKQEIETNRIHSTFFYNNSSTEVMPIRTNGIDVQFDGERRPGKELGQKLAQVGWLDDANVYFIVTDDKYGHGKESIDTLAVHIIIEKTENGKKLIYNAALRTPDKAMQILKGWYNDNDSISQSKKNTLINDQINRLRDLRREIIMSYINTYAPDYLQKDSKSTLPTVAVDGVKPKGLRISNGSINNTKNGKDPIFRSLTDVKEFGLSKDPQVMSQQIKDGEVELGYGEGPFSSTIPYQILHFDGSSQTSAQGIGYAGKIYLIPNVSNTPSGRVSVPIMLSEKRHFLGERAKNFKLSYGNKFDARFDENGKRIPLTSAELVFRLLTHTITLGNDELDSDILDILAHTGSQTIIAGDDRAKGISFLIRKALHVYTDEQGTEHLIYAEKAPEGYRLKYLPIRDINGKILFTEAQAARAIKHIAMNIHWNTDKVAMSSPIPESIRQDAIQYMNRFNTDTYRVLNCDDLQFTMEDLGLTRDADGNVIAVPNAPLLITWMINHQVLKTDVAPQAFIDPFIYVDGVHVQDKPKIKAQPVVEQTEPVQPKKEEKTEEKPAEEQSKEPEQPKEHTWRILDITAEEFKKQYGRKLVRGKIVVIRDDGKVVQIEDDSKTAQKLYRQRGYDNKGNKFFSTEKGQGKVDVAQEKKWLEETLGINPDDVFATTAVMRMADSPSVYGVMEVVWDRLLQEFRPRIILSQQAGRGVGYHEGYHYASMLILNEEQRNQVYSDYVNRHKQYKDATKREVEELLAEEFRNYMLNEENPTLTYRIRKFFRTLKHLILRLAGKQINFQTQFFEAIRTGKFKNYKLDQNTLKEFNSAYESGLYYYFPGMTEQQQKQLPHVTNANQMYTIIDSLTTSALQYSELRNKEDIETFSLDPVFDELEMMYDDGEYDDQPSKRQIVEDILVNRDLFINYIRNYLQHLGIKYTESRDENDQDAIGRDGGDQPDNIWDRASYEFSKKENVAFNAKLFFYSLPFEKYEIDEDGVRRRVKVKDGMFGLTKTIPFNIAWNKILEKLWNVDNWEQLIEKTRRLSNADPFFGTLLDVIDNPEFPLDEVTVTQLLTTIQSSKNSMDTLEVSNDTIQFDGNNKRWDLFDSDNLRYIARLPQTWSNNFILSGLIVTDKAGKQYVSQERISPILAADREIKKSLISMIKSKNRDRKDDQETFNSLKIQFVDMVNRLGITFDVDSLDFLLANMPVQAQSRSDIDGLDAFYKFYVTNNFQKKVLGSIATMARNKTLEMSTGAYKVSADRVFNTNDPSSHISLMAVAYGNVNPSPEELSVTGADGNLVYPISENNYMSDQIRWLNNNSNNKLQELMNASYSKNSLIVKALSSDNKPKLKLHTMINFKEKMSGTSRDYFGISPLEDYIMKMFLSHNNRLILPTMSDKKTWYSISGLNTAHDVLSTVSVDRDIDGVQVVTTGNPYRFSNATLDIFYNYFVDEFNAIVDYYNNIPAVESNETRYIANYHGKIGKNGKMKPGGNGGKFRYFNQLKINGEYKSLNDMLTAAEETGDLDLVKEVLSDFKRLYIEDKESFRTIINDTLQDLVAAEVEKAIGLGVISRNSRGMLINKNIPTNMLSDYTKLFAGKAYTDNAQKRSDIIYSIMGNYVVNYMISIEELEKCFIGDPAFYKWKTTKRKVLTEIYDPSTGGYSVIPVTSVTTRDVDKIKRLSSVLSTGTNLRNTWGDGDPRNVKYFTTVTMSDNMIGSDYHQQLYEAFRASWIRTFIQRKNPSYSDAKLFDMTSKDNIEKSFKELTKEEQAFVEKQAKNAANPYAYDDNGNSGEINQADAAVYIRPAFYKRILQSLGQWNDEIAEAFDILERDPDENGKTFMNDPELYAKSLKAAIHPLKMMYFGSHYDNGLSLNTPIFDKMALFPMFKCLAKADNKYLYDRMNDEGLGVIDMMVFESASKVGAPAKKFRPYKDNKNTQFNTEDLYQKSSQMINSNGAIQQTDGKLTVQVQNIQQLRLQLNTDPHHDVERSFGTQAVKICFGNVVDDRTYGGNKGLSVSGEQIKKDVFGCLNGLADIGYKSIVGDKKTEGSLFTKGQLDNRKLSKYLVRQATNDGMSQEIVDALKLDRNNDFKAPIASLSVRNWIESKIMSFIGREIVDVNTPGGAAIQMAPFGFKANGVIGEGDARPFNNGRKLDFDPNKGSMEVMLSIKFFKYIIPKEYQTDFNTMRKWLIDHGIINNPGEKVFKAENKNEQKKLDLLMQPAPEGLSARTDKFIKDFNIKTIYDLSTYATMATGKTKDEILDYLESLNLSVGEVLPKYKEEQQLIQAKPMGIGYRIPTQGLSSTISFIVADVLPEQVGDAIVVPDEFTAMTGSDYDVDKLYIAMYAYDPDTHERYVFDDSKDYGEQSKGALINKLIDSYTLVISDEKTISETRASIDTLTKLLQKEILPLLQDSTDEEAKPFYELMPSFQESRKYEYTGGKAGIAPFALNSTNHCITQAVHLSMKYSHKNVYGLGQLYEIKGQDGFNILDWLSAMINAHVDVAKDPYIMTLNVNKVTYNLTNLLLRGGKGRTTFYFLAQPILKELTNRKIANDGVVGVTKVSDAQIIEELYDKYYRQLKKLNPQLAKDFKADDDNANLAMDDTRLISALKNFKNKSQTADDIVQQLLVLRAYSVLSQDAQTLSDLVQRSQIDTKKYGNNLSQLQNFYNSYKTFQMQNSDKFSTPNNLKDGLQSYFGDTFLSKKLNYVISTANAILQNQLYTATAAYKTIYTGVMSRIFGEIGSGPEKDNLFKSCGIYYYKPTSDKKRVKKINDRIESIIRARVADLHTDISIDDDTLNTMLFGGKSMAYRLNQIKHYITVNKDNPHLATLVNYDGTIGNEMLKYLLAILSRDDSRLKRIVTVQNSMTNDAMYENRLVSAFYDLLTSEDDKVRQFANDLVKYAFYTSYDTKTPNSFFNLVPLEFKIKLGYASATSDAITALNSGKFDEVSAYFNFENVDDYIQSIYNSLVRNYWNDNDIVRPFNPIITMWEDENGQHSSSSADYLAYGNMQTGTYKWSRVPVLFVTRNRYDIDRGSEYVKTTEQSNTAGCLYRAIGRIVDHRSAMPTIGLVYAIVPKLGLNAGSSSVFELYKNGDQQSAFSQNNFSKSVSNALQNIDKYLKQYVIEQTHRRRAEDGNIEFVKFDISEIQSATNAGNNIESPNDIADQNVESNESADLNIESNESISEHIEQDLNDLYDNNIVPEMPILDNDLTINDTEGTDNIMDAALQIDMQLQDMEEFEPGSNNILDMSLNELSDMVNDTIDDIQDVINSADTHNIPDSQMKKEARKRKKYCGKNKK